MGLFTREPAKLEDRAYIATAVADVVCQSGPQVFQTFFRDARLGRNQTVSKAEAEIIALWPSSTVHALWGVWTQKPISTFLDLYAPIVSSKLKDKPGCREHFLLVAADREKEFMKKFPRTEEAYERDAFCLAALWVRYIQGTYDAELEKTGLHSGTDFSLAIALWGALSNNLASTAEPLRKCNDLFT
jgi:hypothetical protein